MKRVILFWILIMVLSYFCFGQTPTELLINGGFEQSKSLYPWVVETTKGGVLVSGPNENGNPHGGNRYVTLGGTNKETDAIYQSVIVPGNIQSLTLSFALRIKSTGNDKTAHDYLKVFLKGEAIDVEVAEFSNLNESGWRVITIDGLEGCASGALVNLLFQATTDGTKPTKFMVDDVSLKYIPSPETPTTPNFEFISPRFGCIYPSLDYQTITGAQPLTLLAYAPNGIQSFYVELDGEIIATTDQNILQVSVDWSSLIPGEHTLEGTLIGKDGLVIVKRCAIPSTNLLEGADFEDAASAYWSESSSRDSSLIAKVGDDYSFDGYYAAVLGGKTGTQDVLEQMVFFPGDCEDTVTLSFFYNTPINSSITKTSVEIRLIDAETDAIYPIATIGPTSSGWTLVRAAFSLSELGIQSDYPYWLSFKVAAENSDTLLTPYYFDDIALYVYSATLAAGQPTQDPSDIPGAEESTPNPSALKPQISAVDLNYGKKEGGDPMNITGSGFDQNDIMVKFRRILLSGTVSYGNWVRRQAYGSIFNVTWHDPLNSAWIKTVTENQITMAPSGVNDKNNPTNCQGLFGCGTPSSYDGKYGKVRIVVKNTASNNGNCTGFGWQNGKGFRYGFLQPIVNDVIPNTLDIRGGGQYGKFDIYGANFVDPKVQVGNIDCTIISYDSGHITAALPDWNKKCCSNSCYGVVNSSRRVTVINPDNQSGYLDNAITLTPAPSPVITSFSPTSGPYSGKTTVTLKGQSFGRISSIKVDGQYADCTQATITDDRTLLTFSTPEGCDGPIQVFTQDNTFGSTSSNFNYDDRPLTYTNIYPTGGTTSPGWACPLDKHITIYFNGSPDCDAIDYDKTDVSIAPYSTDVKSRLTVSKEGGSTSDNNRSLKLHLTSTACGDNNVPERHILTVNAYTKSTFSSSPKTFTFDIWVEKLSENLSVTASATPTSGVAPLTVNFSCSAAGGNSPYTYSWTFGDGTTSTSQNPSHTYQTSGTYNATVTVTDSSTSHLVGSQTIVITVTPSGGQLTVSASATPISAITPPLTVNFTSTPSGGYSPYTYYWTFGDGGISTLQNPSHTYTTTGIFTATVKVTDSHSNTATASLSIKIGKITPE